jgi:cytochrome c peroxidase
MKTNVTRKLRMSTLITIGILVMAIGLVSGVAVAAKNSGAASGDIVALGKAIFFDTNLSRPVGESCASCHDPMAGFADPNLTAVSRGAIQSRVGNRNAPSAAYAMFSPELHYDPTMRPGIMEGMYVGGMFWDGRANTLEDQAKGPFLNPLEMHNPDEKTVVLAVRQSDYADLFKKVFGENSLDNLGNDVSIDVAYEHVAEAIAAYERSSEVNLFTSKFDFWKKGEAEFTASEQRGYMLFTDTTMMGAKCANCHSVSIDESQSPSLFTNFGYQNIGAPRNPELPYYYLPKPLNSNGTNFIDLGLGDYLRSIGVSEEQASKEDGKLKVPSLRNCAVTAPYEHNGVFTTLKKVVMFNNTRDVPGAGWPAPEVPQNVHRHMPPMPRTFGQLGLTNQQVDDIVAFLNTLTDGYKPKTR